MWRASQEALDRWAAVQGARHSTVEAPSTDRPRHSNTNEAPSPARPRPACSRSWTSVAATPRYAAGAPPVPPAKPAHAPSGPPDSWYNPLGPPTHSHDGPASLAGASSCATTLSWCRAMDIGLESGDRYGSWQTEAGRRMGSQNVPLHWATVAEERVAELRAAELREAELGAAEISAELRAAEVIAAETASKLKSAELRAANMRAAETAAEIRAVRMRAAEMRMADLRAAEMRAAKMRAEKMKAAETALIARDALLSSDFRYRSCEHMLIQNARQKQWPDEEVRLNISELQTTLMTDPLQLYQISQQQTTSTIYML